MLLGTCPSSELVDHFDCWLTESVCLNVYVDHNELHRIKYSETLRNVLKNLVGLPNTFPLNFELQLSSYEPVSAVD
jgi:hypothetical protein